MHDTWKLLQYFGSNDLFKESKQHYIERQKKCFSHLSEEVLLQFFREHSKDKTTIKLYGHLDFNKLQFKKIQLSIPEILNLKIYSEYAIIDKNNDYIIQLYNWNNMGTWKIAPLIMPNKYCINSNLYRGNGEYILIEGHTRLGVLRELCFNNCKFLNQKHDVWILDDL